ncbi:MAG TPA: universal stress protein [Beijerinckiaceae bacterium]|jgi:nucleotide-binding universal stress UspA family protein
MFSTILVPVDLGEPDLARPAIDRAVALAGANGTVRLIYVRSLVPVTFMEFVPPNFDTEQQGEAEQKLAAITASIPLPPERVSSVVTLGTVYHDVLEEADKVAADLIVIGSHRPRMASYLLGSNASTIVRHAKCSVLVVR